MADHEQRVPAGFGWGASAAAYQIEGTTNEDGRGEAIWDRFSHGHATVENGDTGDIAWSRLGNFECSFGFTKRFSIAHVYSEAQSRTVKGSGRWYAEVAAENRLVPMEGDKL